MTINIKALGTPHIDIWRCGPWEFQDLRGVGAETLGLMTAPGTLWVQGEPAVS